MTEVEVGAILEREHREIDAHLDEVRAGLGAGQWRTESLASAAAALRRHIFVEEELLFPALREAGLYGPVAVMLREHGEIWIELDRLEALVTSQGNPAEAERVHGQLMQVLEAHNSKEEQILYPAADQVTQLDVKDNVRQYLKDGQLPTGWVCNALSGRT